MRNFKACLIDRRLLFFVFAVSVSTLFACVGTDAPEPESEIDIDTQADMSETEPTSSLPRVYFVAPEDGDTLSVDNPVVFEFGIENYGLAEVPEQVEQSRLGMGHHHLGVNTECLPVGELIPKSDPWVHFGDASSTIEMMLEPGEHSFALQLGNDEHRTQEDLCETITIRVEEGI